MASQPLQIRGPQTSDVWKRPVITITETMLEFGCHAFLPNWLFWCSFFSSILFLRQHGCPPLSSLDEENLVGFQLHPARTFRIFFDGKKSHWRPQGPHRPPFMYRKHNTCIFDSWHEMTEEKKLCVNGIQCVWVNVWAIWCVCLCVCHERGTQKPHEGSPYLHN